MIRTGRRKRRCGAALAASFALFAPTACSGFGEDPVADLAAVTVVADDQPDVEASVGSGGETSDVDGALRVTVRGESMDASMLETTLSSNSTTSTLPTTRTTPSVTYPPTTLSTSTTAATTASSSSTASGSDSTASTSEPPSSTTTAPPPPAVLFPDISVTNHGSGQIASLADQVAGSRPVLVWFWLPG